MEKSQKKNLINVVRVMLIEASKEQLKHKSGEQIVDEDIAKQMEK